MNYFKHYRNNTTSAVTRAEVEENGKKSACLSHLTQWGKGK